MFFLSCTFYLHHIISHIKLRLAAPHLSDVSRTGTVTTIPVLVERCSQCLYWRGCGEDSVGDVCRRLSPYAPGLAALSLRCRNWLAQMER